MRACTNCGLVFVILLSIFMRTPAHSRALPRTPAHSRALPRTPAHSRTLPHTSAHSCTLPHTSAHFRMCWYPNIDRRMTKALLTKMQLHTGAHANIRLKNTNMPLLGFINYQTIGNKLQFTWRFLVQVREREVWSFTLVRTLTWTCPTMVNWTSMDLTLLHSGYTWMTWLEVRSSLIKQPSKFTSRSHLLRWPWPWPWPWREVSAAFTCFWRLTMF